MNEDIVKGWESLSRALYFYVDTAKKESNKKQFFRKATKYKLPIYRQNNRIYMFREDIEIINQFYLFDIRNITWYIGIHIKTLHKWKKKYPKMPVDIKRKIAHITALDLWCATLIFERRKRGKTTRALTRPGSPIVKRFNHIRYVLKRTGLSHPKELRQYWLHPGNDILDTLKPLTY